MKQVMQNYRTGELRVEEVPAPILKNGGVLVRTVCSLISAGTEKGKVELARRGLLGKIKARPDQVRLVLNNITQEGLWLTFKKAMNKLDSPISLGYSCAGRVIKISQEVKDFSVGDRVACVGEKFAAHAQVNFVPVDMCIRIPNGLNFEQSAFVGLGAIALNAVEVAQLKPGERVAVIGLGLLGQLVVQIAKSEGCRVFGVELDDEKLSLARDLGMDCGGNLVDDNIEALALDFTFGEGADAVIIPAGSKDNKPLELAGKISRDKGRVILLGALPAAIPRKDYYEKELYFVISRGFGAGLYYKMQKNRSYPYGYIPRTIKDNMCKFLQLVAGFKVNVDRLVTHRFVIDEAKKAYELIGQGKEKHIGVIFQYDKEAVYDTEIVKLSTKAAGPATDKKVKIGFIGAGSFACGYILPELKRSNKINFKGLVCATGISSKNTARKYGFEYCASDYNKVMNDPEVNCVFITTRHDTHAKLCAEALKNNKAVFVEKPLATNEEELREILRAYNQRNGRVMVGFNRRFSPFITRAKEFFKNRTGPLMINYRINAGLLDSGHWLHDSREGAGRVIGEVCHFIDLLCFLTGALPLKVYVESVGSLRKDMPKEDNVCITLSFCDGSVGQITYCALGDVSYPRERIEIFGANSIGIINNFRKAEFVRKRRKHTMSLLSRDMGYKSELSFFIEAIASGSAMPISFNELVNSTIATLKAAEALKSGEPQAINIKDWQVE